MPQELYAILRSAIFNGTLQPNERLVEDAIATAANVSRTPVREALRKLEMEGLVQQSGRLKLVAAPTPHQLSDVLTVRVHLEGLAGRLAAVNRIEGQVHQLQEIYSASLEAARLSDGEQTILLNDAFHNTVWQAAGNEYLLQQLTLLRGSVQRLQHTHTMLSHRERLYAALDEHNLILQAVAEQDAKAAELHCQTHFRNAAAIRLATYSHL